MASIDFGKQDGTRLVIVQGMPQTKKSIIFRKAPRFVNPTMRKPAMLQAEIALGTFAIQHRGTFGTVQMPNGTVISRLAYEAGEALRGKNYGGLSYDERLRQNQVGAEASIEKLRKILANKQGIGSGRNGRFMGE